MSEYNQKYEGQNMQLQDSIGYKRIPQLMATFNKKWHPQSQKNTFIAVFSLSAWAELSSVEKHKHTIRNCTACHTQHLSLSRAFPDKVTSKALDTENPTIVFTRHDLTSPTKCGRKILAELNAVCQENFDQSFQEVITKTPRSKLISKPTSQIKQTTTRKIIRATKRAIQNTMDTTGVETVMTNRISWRKYDRIRKRETLVSPSTEAATTSTSQTTTPSRHHGSSRHLSTETKATLLQEAQTWTANTLVNWSELARSYGLTKANDGQTIKEFLREHDIAAAMNNHSSNLSARRKRKRLPEGIPFPMQRPSVYHKKKLAELVDSGKIAKGTPVAPTTITSFSYDHQQSAVVESTSQVYARKHTLLEIRTKLLRKHEEMGLLRGYTDNDLTRGQLVERLVTLGESIDPTSPVDELRSHLQTMSTTRYLKMWHDHSTIGGHGHFMVLISVIYDPAFFLTSEEAKEKLGREIDVQSIVEAPELHILGRSTSSLEDQAAFNSCRKTCVLQLSSGVSTSIGQTISDILRLFHGDGPAQQFEAGNTVGGNCSCVGCGARSDRMDDIAYTFRSAKLSLEERQSFLLKGKVWRNIAVRPLDKLLLKDLQEELKVRDRLVQGRKKPALEKEFEELRMGINNFPALLQDDPEASLTSLHLQKYEISPTEPLHDLKGHLSNIIEESLVIAEGQVREAISSIKRSLLSKDSIRCSDLRKATILIYLKLEEVAPNGQLTGLFRTAVEISSMCYAHDSKRTPKNILYLHNRTFLHALQCSSLFTNPKTMTRRKMFGRYFHSIVSHAALMFRMISLRSLNTEQHERLFQQAKGITKGTTNHHAEHVISNIIQRLQFEDKQECTAEQETQIQSLAKAVGPVKNTMISKHLMNQYSSHYQAHLEWISDYLARGPGVWWRRTDDGGAEFFDGTDEEGSKTDGPQLQHFRSTSIPDIELHLFNNWETICTTGIELPATTIRCYNQQGSLTSLHHTNC